MFAGLFFVLPHVSVARGAAQRVGIFSGKEHKLPDGHGGYLLVTFNWTGSTNSSDDVYQSFHAEASIADYAGDGQELWVYWIEAYVEGDLTMNQVVSYYPYLPDWSIYVYEWNIEQGTTGYCVYGVNGYPSNVFSYSSNAHTYIYYPVLGWLEQGSISCTVTYIVGSNPTGNCSHTNTGV